MDNCFRPTSRCHGRHRATGLEQVASNWRHAKEEWHADGVPNNEPSHTARDCQQWAEAELCTKPHVLKRMVAFSPLSLSRPLNAILRIERIVAGRTLQHSAGLINDVNLKNPSGCGWLLAVDLLRFA